MKKYCLIMLAVAVSLAFMASTAYAIALPPIPVPESDTPYVALSGNTAQKTTFGWDEKPFAYLSLSQIDTGRQLHLKNIWKYGGSPDIVTNDFFFVKSSSAADWTGLDNWTDAGIRKTGDWILETTWGYTDSRYSYCVKNPFTVTPEPFSAALFLLGGVALSTRKFFKGKKKHLVLLLALTLGLGLMAGTGYAVTSNPLPPYPADDTPYMTLDSNTTQKTTFGWNEKPFVYLNLPAVDSFRTLNLQHIWKFGGSVEDTQNFTFTGSSLTDWKGLSNWLGTGLGSRKTGEWTVVTTWGYDGSKYSACCTETKFTVTPEPIGMVLFGLGAGVLGLAKLRRKKK